MRRILNRFRGQDYNQFISAPSVSSYASGRTERLGGLQ